MVSGELLALLGQPALVALTELLVLSGQREIWVLPDPRVGLDHKAHLDRRVTLVNVVLRVNVERLVLLALPVLWVSVVLLAPVWITSGPSR